MSSSATTVFTTDFETGVPAEITGAGALTGTEGYAAFGFGSNYYRNDSAGDPAAATNLALGGLPAHTHVEITFDLAVIDSWDGDTITGGTAPIDFFNVEIDGASVFNETFDNFDATDQSYSGPATVFGVLSLAQNGGWPDSAYPISITLPHVADSLSVNWFASGNGWQAGLDESWAIDNLEVTLRGTGDRVPDGGPGLLGFSLLILSGWVSHRARRR